MSITEGIDLYLGSFSRILGIFFNASTSTWCMIRLLDAVFQCMIRLSRPFFEKHLQATGFCTDVVFTKFWRNYTSKFVFSELKINFAEKLITNYY